MFLMRLVHLDQHLTCQTEMMCKPLPSAAHRRRASQVLESALSEGDTRDPARVFDQKFCYITDSWDLGLRLIAAKPCGRMWCLPPKHASKRFNQSLWCKMHQRDWWSGTFLIQFLRVIRRRFVLGSFWFKLKKSKIITTVGVFFLSFMCTLMQTTKHLCFYQRRLVLFLISPPLSSEDNPLSLIKAVRFSLIPPPLPLDPVQQLAAGGNSY